MELSQAERNLSELIHTARRSRTTLAGTDGQRGVDLAGAYRIQAASQGKRILKGYKFGLISPAKQQQMGINTPLYGRIYADMLHRGTISLGQFIQPRLEPEIAVVLRDPIPPDASIGCITTAIGGYFLGVDILDSVWEKYKFTASEVVADNTSGGGFILAEQMSSRMMEGTLRLFINGELKTEGHIADLGNPVARLVWLAGIVGGLDAGMTIFFGSPAASIPTEAGVLEVTDAEGHVLMVKLVE
jgi:2-keto-4-pentenoate hydratase